MDSILIVLIAAAVICAAACVLFTVRNHKNSEKEMHEKTQVYKKQSGTPQSGESYDEEQTRIYHGTAQQSEDDGPEEQTQVYRSSDH